jgi:anti-sigma-K factor RskA
VNPLSCPDVEELAPELALGTLPGDQRAAVLAHLDRCPDCRRYLNKLSDTADSLLLLAPEVDPPAGFTRRVVAGLTPARRRWRPVALAAVAALVFGLAVGYVPGHVRSGSANVAVASFVDTGAEPGETVGGHVYARADNPSWVFMTVHGTGSDESYACDLVLKDGRTVPIGSFTMHAGAGSWGRAVDVTLSQVRQVQLRDAKGDLVAKAPLAAS